MTDKILLVRDLLGTNAGVARTHVLLDKTGAEHSVTFAPGQQVEIPFDIAFALVTNDGFEVCDGATGRRIKADPMHGQMAKLELKPDEVIANLKELKREALIARAKRLPGGEDVPAAAKVEDLILFVMAGGMKPDGEVADRAPASFNNEQIAA